MIKYYEFNQAVEESAWQNFCHDVNNEVVEYDDWEVEKSIYLEEAKEILTSTGFNYAPEDGENWIGVLK